MVFSGVPLFHMKKDFKRLFRDGFCPFQ